MQHCKYHPLNASTYYCEECEIHQCDHCVDGDLYSESESDIHCFLCGNTLENLGTGNGATPFWRRLKETFHYPFSGDALTLIIGVAVLSSAIYFIFGLSFISVILNFLLLSPLLNYAFRCLAATAEGDMQSPKISAAYDGGHKLLAQLIGIIVLLSILTTAVGALLGLAIGGLFGTFVIIALPAIIISLAHSENLIEALHPKNIFRVLSIGLPYGLVIAFIAIMMSSVGVINQLIGGQLSFLGNLFGSIVSNYYMVVMFHMMGYMLYQYQHKLGYTTRIKNEDDAERTPEQIHTDKINVFLKEGKYTEVVNLYNQAFTSFPQDIKFAQQYFEFSYRSSNKELITEAANRYLHLLVKNKQFDKINFVYKQATQVLTSFIPQDPDARLIIARSSYDLGDVKTAALMLNNLHKQSPKFPRLSEAYLLFSKVAKEIPSLAQHSEKLRVFAEKISAKNLAMAGN